MPQRMFFIPAVQTAVRRIVTSKRGTAAPLWAKFTLRCLDVTITHCQGRGFVWDRWTQAIPSARINLLRSTVSIFARAILALALGQGLTGFGQEPTASRSKPRVVVLTDISNEPDDEESLVRFLVYSSDYDIEGIVATTSVWLRSQVRPDIIHHLVHAYGQVRGNLLLHARGFPSEAQLQGVVKASSPLFGMAGVGDDKASEGSRHLIGVIDRADARNVWVCVWGGTNCLAQALWDVRRTRSPAQVEAFVAKLRVYAISDQDDSGPWLRREFPHLFYIVSPSTVDSAEYYLATWSGISGDRVQRNFVPEHFELVDNPWLTVHVRENHGPLGALYPPLKFIMEGDTPSFLNLIDNGLCGEIRPDYGAWGGRYFLRQSYGESRPIWTNVRDTVKLSSGLVVTSNQATIWRWRLACQNDFAARMDWCVQPFAQANHNPLAVVNGIAGKKVINLSAKPGAKIALSAAGSSDPNGNLLSYRWFHYPEAGGRDLEPEVPVEDSASEKAWFTVPPGTRAINYHLILEVRNSGSPNLFAYRRVIVAAEP